MQDRDPSRRVQTTVIAVPIERRAGIDKRPPLQCGRHGLHGATMVDVTELPDVKIGDEVVLIGRQGEEEILADDIAPNGNTINYEIICRFRRG